MPKPATRVERDPADAHRLLITVRGAFGDEEISVHEADAGRLIEQMREALKESAFDARQRLDRAAA